MAFASTEETDSITKMLEAIQTMEKYGKTLNEMKTRVEEKLSRGRERAKEQEASFILSEARDEDERKRKVLLDFCTKIKDFLDKIDEKDSNLVKVHLGNVQEEMKSHMTQLQQKEYYILVAGETCAGKTTVVNLILGETLLPYSALRTTSTICEVRYGEERKLVVHFKDKDPETGQLTKTIFLEEPTGSPEKSYLSQISPYVHWNGDDEQSPVFKKTEIFWPHSLLQKGIVIIDSPGVGESDDDIDQMVIQYLPQAFAFIYVINSTNGGGIQKDRLVKLLLDVQELPLGFQEQTLQQRLLSKCALFVFNKWDQIDTNERETFRDRVTKKLQKLSPGIDPESQMIYISAKGAALAQNYGYATEDLSSLVSHMKTLVEKSIATRLEIHWRWLNFRVSEIIVEAKMYMMNASRNREEASRKLAKVICRLKEIEKQKRKVGPALREKELQDLYQPIVNEGSKIRGQLQEFGIKETLVPDIASEELQWKEDRLSLIGQGTFATVYQGTITRNGNVKTVALKVCGVSLDAQNACILVEEVETLRKLNHPNIVKFYGTSLLKERDTVTVILVMEKCKGDLKNQIKKDPKSFPGQSEDPGSVRVVGRWVVEIVGALDYIHSQGIVHRDLKPGNILLSDENAVKIADVGLAKQAANITGTYVGTPAYMAPEVFHSRAYDSKADMYSLGILLWEMWYGQRFPVPVETPTELFTMVDGGYRPGDVEGCRPPPDCWKELMERCWQGNPEKRPTAESCKNEAKMIVSLFENTEYGPARQ